AHKDNLKFPYEERGLQFGDGVYEVIRIYLGRPYLLEEHVARLFRSLDAVRIRIKQTEEEMIALLNNLIKKNEMKQDGYIYLQVTRGSAPRKHLFPENTTPNLYAYLVDQERSLDGIEHGVKAISIRDETWTNCYINSLNLLPNVLAKQTAHEKGCYEAILHDDNVVTECSSANVFLVKDEKIYTHPATNRILNGCVRMAVKRFAKELNIPFIEQPFTGDDMVEADQLSATRTL